MKKLLFAVLSSALLAACGEDTPPPAGFPQPAGTVAVNFSVDDSVNKVYGAGELEWKGSMDYDAATRIVTLDTTWVGTATNPTIWAPLYDDGPWTASGHEPVGSVAGDHKWGVTVFIAPPAAGGADLVFEYGLRDTTAGADRDAGWAWIGTNGSFTIKAGDTGTKDAPGQTFPAFGTKDLKLVFDKAASSNAPATITKAEAKGSSWGWVLKPAVDDATKGDDAAADNKYTWLMSENIGAHTGLNKTGDVVQFVFVLNNLEYRDTAGVPSHTGIKAYSKDKTASTWTEITITNQPAGDKNNIVTIP